MQNRLAALSSPVRVVIVGAGAMGRGLCYQCSRTPGIQLAGIADIVLERAVQAAEITGRPYRMVRNINDAEACAREGITAVCEDGELLARAAGSDVFLESTNTIAAGGILSQTALYHGKHLVLMNAEVDLIFGPYLAHLAHRNGLSYASCDGDQHGVIKRIYDEMTLWGFEPIMAGNIKGFLDRYSNPTVIIPEADKRNLDYRMCAAYTDGTKLNIEMALVSNALGLQTDVVGMHGPRAARVEQVFDVFPLEQMRARGGPYVDYLLGAEPGGGVFVIGYCDHPYQQQMMAYYKMGPGPYYLFYRPYHLCHVEAMRCIAEAALDGQSLLEPIFGFRTNVIAYAKRELKAGDVLDGLGGYNVYGLIENCDVNGQTDGLPICLAEEVTLTCDIRKDERIPLAAVRYDPDRFDFATYHKACAVRTKDAA